MTKRRTQMLPRDTCLKMQALLDEADRYWFDHHPTETERRRYYFFGEEIADEPGRHRMVVVTRAADGALVRRSLANEEAAS